MEKYFNINAEDCSIRCKLYSTDREEVRKLILFGHGFGGHKDNKAAERFAKRVLEKNKKHRHRYTDLVEYNLAIETFRANDIEFEAHDMVGLNIPAYESGAFFCDSIGFEKIEFDESRTQKPDNLMRVVYVEPNREPFEAEILPDLEHLQKAVDGYIEAVYLDDGTIVVANEESKLRGMEGNRRIGQTIIAGPFFVCGEGGDDFCSLTDEEAARAMERFAEPEQISQAEVEADMGFTMEFLQSQA